MHMALTPGSHEARAGLAAQGLSTRASDTFQRFAEAVAWRLGRLAAFVLVAAVDQGLNRNGPPAAWRIGQWVSIPARAADVIERELRRKEGHQA